MRSAILAADWSSSAVAVTTACCRAGPPGTGRSREHVMSGMTSGVCVESDLSSMLQRSSAPSHHHHHPNHHGYSGQGQGLSPMLDYSSEMDRYRSSIASFYKSNVNMNVSNFPQSAKLAAIFPPLLPPG
ncbi:hypothetical protein F7725_016225 [Dissostichus mawsoni]|uniref:Uncharacterized protein n=1 Tax=Dissostichus mawsoni TaxID=36200 RepID=A0A7J5Z113_DISMA|nr:hypothetical protein F7725_016225 [Dissostichus mawsoni]